MSHGVYLREKAQLNKMDCLPGKNVMSMGVCSAGYSSICAEQENAKNEKKSFDFSNCRSKTYDRCGLLLLLFIS